MELLHNMLIVAGVLGLVFVILLLTTLIIGTLKSIFKGGK